MGKDFNPRVIRAGPLIATAPRTGNLNDNSAFRIQNMILRGFRESYRYWEEWAGLGDLSEAVPMVALTGTLSIDETTSTVTGIGTLFTQECHLGQFICAIPADNSASYLLVVQQVIDDATMVIWGLPDGTASGLTGWRMPIIFPINNERGEALRGNVLKLDRGSFIGVGDGTFYLNGQVLPGTSLTLSRQPTLALYNATLNSYSCFVLGMDTSAPPTLAAVGGGSKMQGGSYSLVITPARKETGGYNNPSDRADVTIATNDMIAVTFPAMDTANGQDAWIVWGTTFADTLGADLNYLNGPWRRFRMFDNTEVSSAGGTINIEYYDAEIENNELVSFNNDPPTDAEFVQMLNANLTYLSCQGQGNITDPEFTSPGPFIVSSKPRNIEAAPLEFAFSTSPPENILGGTPAQGRIYLPSINTLQIAQGTPSSVIPVIIRPFWLDGFANPYQITFINGYLYGYTLSGPARSVGDGDQIEAQRDWAADVSEITDQWNSGKVLAEYDPLYNAWVIFHPADRLNAAGFWTTKWLMYGIAEQEWLGAGEIGVEEYDREGNPIPGAWQTQDHIVCGVAKVGENLELLMSGRKVI